MAFEVSCPELGVHGRGFSVRAETPAEVLRQRVDHVQDQHNITLPPAGEILTGRYDEALLPKNAQLKLTEDGALAAEEPPVIFPLN